MGVTPGVAHGAEVEAQKIPSISRQGSPGRAHNRAGEREGFSLQTTARLEKLWGGGVRGAEGVSSPCSLTLKKNKKVCVAPEAPWIQLLIFKLTQRYATPSGRKTSGLSNVLAGRSPPPDRFVFTSVLP